MAAEYRTFAITIPAGTAKASPITSSLAMPPRIVRSVRVRTPPGPLGSVGWALGASGVQVIPWNAGAFMVTDGEAVDWPLDGQIDSGAWELHAYNTGVHDHTLYVTFGLDLVTGGQSILSTPLTITA